MTSSVATSGVLPALPFSSLARGSPREHCPHAEPASLLLSPHFCPCTQLDRGSEAVGAFSCLARALLVSVLLQAAPTSPKASVLPVSSHSSEQAAALANPYWSFKWIFLNPDKGKEGELSEERFESITTAPRRLGAAEQACCVTGCWTSSRLWWLLTPAPPSPCPGPRSSSTPPGGDRLPAPHNTAFPSGPKEHLAHSNQGNQGVKANASPRCDKCWKGSFVHFNFWQSSAQWDILFSPQLPLGWGLYFRLEGKKKIVLNVFAYPPLPAVTVHCEHL